MNKTPILYDTELSRRVRCVEYLRFRVLFERRYQDVTSTACVRVSVCRLTKAKDMSIYTEERYTCVLCAMRLKPFLEAEGILPRDTPIFVPLFVHASPHYTYTSTSPMFQYITNAT